MRNKLATLSAIFALCTIAAPIAFAQTGGHAAMASDHMMATADEFKWVDVPLAAARREAGCHRRSAQSGRAGDLPREVSC